jgi:ribonuclease BN (tRNA processing enzyme)
MVALRKFGIDPNTLRAILITHLHGDHFGGLPFLVLEAQLVSRRTTPLTIAGPPGLRARLAAAMENFFPGSTKVEHRFALDIRELDAGASHDVAGIEVTPYEVLHPSGAPSHALRVKADGKILSYSGDTEWVDTLRIVADGADLFITECYAYDRPIRYHLDFATLARHLPTLRAKRIIVTHMSADMLAHIPQTGWEAAEDGLVVSL